MRINLREEQFINYFFLKLTEMKNITITIMNRNV